MVDIELLRILFWCAIVGGFLFVLGYELRGL